MGKRSLKVISYNVHLYHGTTLDIADRIRANVEKWFDTIIKPFDPLGVRKLKRKKSRAALKQILSNVDPLGVYAALDKLANPIQFQDAVRRDMLISRLKKSNADIIGLNEVWHRETRQHIIDHMPDYEGINFKLPPLFGTKDTRVPGLKELLRDAPEHGLLFLCKRETVRKKGHDFIIYEDLTKENFLARKGVLRVRVQIKDGSRAGFPCHVFLTHTQNKRNMKQLWRVVKTTGRGTGPTIILGDLNVEGESKEYETYITAKCKAHDCKDAYRTTTKKGKGYTSTPNKLAKYFFTPPYDDPKRLDYVLVSTDVAVKDIKVVTDWNYRSRIRVGNGHIIDSEVPVSDHYPLEAQLEVTDEP